MVMHSNKRGECFPRTLVDRKRKRYNNAVDVVVRLHDSTDQAPKLWHLRVLAHVQLDDDPRTPIQQSVGDEFRQHDGMVMILMFYRRRASPKHHYDIIEDYRGGGHRTRLRERSRRSTCVFRGAPLPPYIKEQGGGRPTLGARQGGGVLLLVGVGLPFPSPTRKREGGRKERERERGAAPPSPSPIRTPHGRGRATSWAPALSLPSGPLRPNTSPGGSGNPSGTPVFSEITRNTSGVRI